MTPCLVNSLDATASTAVEPDRVHPGGSFADIKVLFYTTTQFEEITQKLVCKYLTSLCTFY